MYNRLSFPQFHFRETSLGWSSHRQSSEWHPLYIDRKCDVFKNGHSPAFSSGYYDNGNGLGHVPHDGLGRVYNDNDIKNNAWVTVNNDFGSRVRRFAYDFHEWRSHEWKLWANRPTSDPKIVIHGNECIILFLTRYFMSWTHNFAKTSHRSLISQLSPRTVVSDLALWRHNSGSVTSREREILALWRHICRLFLHAQIGAKAIFTSE